jgi:hypothetical protein
MEFLDELEQVEIALPAGKYLVVNSLTGTGKAIVSRVDFAYSVPKITRIAELSNERVSFGPYSDDLFLIVKAGSDIVSYGVVNDPSDVTDNTINAATQAALSGKVDKVSGKGLSANDYTTAEKSKLANIEAGAQVNTVISVAGQVGEVELTSADVGLGNVNNTSDANKPISTAVQTALNEKATAYHTHVVADVIGLSATIDDLYDLATDRQSTTEKGQPSGYAPLDGAGKVPLANLPSNLGGGGPANTDQLTEGTTNLYYTDARVRSVALTGLSTATSSAITATDTVLTAPGKLQAQINTATTNIATKADTTLLTAHTTNTSNPHNTTKAHVGLGNVDNTSDAAKPVSTATQTALDGKEPTIVAGSGGQFWAGNKTWRDLATDVRATVLTGLSTATATAATATDSILVAIGKLQAQITGKADTGHTHTNATTTAAGFMSSADKTKLDGIATGATANATDAQLRDRATHTGAQAISTVTGLQTALDGKEATIAAGTTSQYRRGDKT